MIDQIETQKKLGIDEIAQASDVAGLEALRVKWLGRKGAVADVMTALAGVSAEDRPILGKAANALKVALTEALEAKKASLADTNGAEERTPLDLTLPGRRARQGHKHVISQVIDELVGIFKELGFQVADGPEIETEYYNFDCLNTPSDHPARDSHDTFFVRPGLVLRTHTTPIQMRIMERTQPPIAAVFPGRVYRVDWDASHSPMFFQIDGLLVDEGVTFAELKGTMTHFCHRLFGADVKIRFRPHFFPFTEPSAEVDVSCSVCRGAGCRACKHSGWMEILGCGMVHPKVFGYAGYDSEKYTGFAFGLGVDRVAMLKHSIDSIQHLYDNDLRFLEQF